MAWVGVIAAVSLAFIWAVERPPLLFPDATRYLFLGRLIGEWRDFVPGATDGAAVDHPPLLPATLALAFKLSSTGVPAAIVVTRLFGTMALAAVALISGRLFGSFAALISVLLLLGTDYFTPHLSQQIGVDTPQAAFMLMALLLWVTARPQHRTPTMALAGAALGAAFLVKETALVWLPLPLALAIWAPWGPPRRVIVDALTTYVTFAATTAWWWLYVDHTTGALYLDSVFRRGLGPVGGTLGHPDAWLTLLAMAAALALIIRSGARAPVPKLLSSAAARWVAAGAVVLGMLYVTSSSMDVPSVIDYIVRPPDEAKVPRLMADQVPLAPLFGVGWAWVAWRAWHGERWARALSAALFLYLVLLFPASGSKVPLRNFMPLLLLSNVVAAGVIVRAIGLIARNRVRATASAVIAVAAALPLAVDIRDEHFGPTLPRSASEIVAVSVAEWMEGAAKEGHQAAVTWPASWLVRFYAPLEPPVQRVGFISTHVIDQRVAAVLLTDGVVYIGGRLPGWDSVYVVVTEVGIFAEARSLGSNSLVWSVSDPLRTPLVLSSYWERVRDVDVLFRAAAVVAFSLEGIESESGRSWMLTNSVVLRDLVGRPERFGGNDLFAALATKEHIYLVDGFGRPDTDAEETCEWFAERFRQDAPVDEPVPPCSGNIPF